MSFKVLQHGTDRGRFGEQHQGLVAQVAVTVRHWVARLTSGVDVRLMDNRRSPGHEPRLQFQH